MITSEKRKTILKVIQLREVQHLKFKEIGKQFSRSTVWASTFYSNGKRQIETERLNKDPFLGLSVRASNVIANSGLRNKRQVISAINDGSLNLMRSRNCGLTTHNEIMKWAGLPPFRGCKFSYYYGKA